MIAIKDLTVKYGEKHKETLALDRVNIEIGAGEIYTFIGPSGCGKSTLLYVLSGILRDYTGSVTIDGRAIDPQSQRIGLILQNYGLLPWKTVYQNTMLGTKIKGTGRGGRIRPLHSETIGYRFPFRPLSQGIERWAAAECGHCAGFHLKT